MMRRLVRVALAACATRGASGVDPRRAVFLHVNQCGGGSFMAWMTRYSKWCHEADGRFCGVLEHVCTLQSFEDGEREDGPKHGVDPTACGDRIRDLAARNCSFVELHHYDARVAAAFERLGPWRRATARRVLGPGLRGARRGRRHLGRRRVDPRDAPAPGALPEPLRRRRARAVRLRGRRGFRLANASQFWPAETPRAGRDDAACRRPEVRSAALERLRDFAVVGTTERLADTRSAFALRFGLDVDGLARAVEGASRRNPSVHYFRLSEATRRAFANTARVDAALHDAAAAKLDALLERRRARGAEAFDDRRRRFFADAALPPPPPLAPPRARRR
ncbi:hypothetical protein JL722_1310 [Aureococcus anophagefferens]|nr:hypothetical protein JL722_1310 [Aureococcus anophagefferens]